MESKPGEIISDNWAELKKFTDARIALGRTGASLPTEALLEFQLAHALARDAVHAKLNSESLETKILHMGLNPLILETLTYDRNAYLKNPELGRNLSENSVKTLREKKSESGKICFVVGDGLSARAIQENATDFIQYFFQIFDPKEINRTIPILSQARVAIGDHIGEILNSEMVIVLIGERPGLSSPNSMGIYLTFRPQIGKKDSERNCISNVRKEGLSIELAAKKLAYLIQEAKRLQLSGVDLKDQMENRNLVEPEKSIDFNKFS